MSNLVVITYCWSAICAYICLDHFMRFRLGMGTRHLHFSAYAFAQIIYAVGQAEFTSATTYDDALDGIRLTSLATVCGISTFVVFCEGLHRQASRLSQLIAIWFVIGLVGIGMDTWVNASGSVIVDTWGLMSFEYITPKLSTAGLVFVMCGWVTALVALGRLVPQVAEDWATRIIFIGMSANVLSGAHDLLVRLTAYAGPYLLEHFTMLSIIAMSEVMIRQGALTEETLSRQDSALAETVSQLQETMNARSKQAYRAATGRMARSIAHEIRNPLTSIKNSAAGLRRGPVGTERTTTLIGIVQEEIHRLNELVNDLSLFAREELNEVAELEVEELFHYLQSEIEGRPEEERVEFTRDPAIRTVTGDIRLLRHALGKLLNNALAATTERGKVRLHIKASDTQGWVELECTDTGVGMNATTLEQASDPFFTTRATGIGLGLALVRKAAELHGGGMSIESQMETGTRVVIYFPRDEAQLP